MKKTVIIAEAGVNHNGKIDDAIKLVDAAADAGADIVKFQTFRAQQLTTKRAPLAIYQQSNNEFSQSQYDMLRKLELSEEAHRDLLKHSIDKGIIFLSSAFDLHSLNFIMSLGVKMIKIASGEITNLPFLRHAATFQVPIILSTGMASMVEIQNAVNVLEVAGSERSAIILLHCSTDYPTPMEDVNLKVMSVLKTKFETEVGYSDHTSGIEVPIAAVALGAKVIEKHITLDRTLSGPDHKASLEPQEFKFMVKSIRNIENALGNGIKRISDNEEKNKLVSRKSIVAAMPIKIGEMFTNKNITTKRPGTGISAIHWDEVVGRISTKNYSIDEFIGL